MDNLDPIAERLSDALARIARGVNAATVPQVSAREPEASDASELLALRAQITTQAQEMGALRTALSQRATDTDVAQSDIAQERAEKEELAARVALLQKQLEAQDIKHQKAIGRLTEKFDALDSAGQRLQHSNADLRETNGQLRRAAEDGVADAALINRAMQAELDALRAARAVEAEEVGAVFEALAPILKGAQ